MCLTKVLRSKTVSSKVRCLTRTCTSIPTERQHHTRSVHSSISAGVYCRSTPVLGLQWAEIAKMNVSGSKVELYSTEAGSKVCALLCSTSAASLERVAHPCIHCTVLVYCSCILLHSFIRDRARSAGLLSGSGTTHTAGVRAINEAGGLGS